MTGTVKFWHETKGYAFITDEQGVEYYTYKPYLSGIERLWNGLQVSFDIKPKQGEPDHAINVKSINNN